MSIAIAAATLIATKISEGAGAALGDAVRSGITRVYDAIRAKFAGDSEIEDSITRLEDRPESQARMAELAENLERRLAEDPGFATALEKLINEVPHDDARGPSFMATVKGNAIVGKLTNIGNVQGNIQF